ncbi:HAD hydrolase family protein [Novisyntrophococcus fermenticellae]|uniref:HAD hydrolase family protein n=1 Tax=Novisyntrophococcus fermenticellae TaxID=2068655 RepID=UPI001E61F2BA|nr:HAD hydrolase family protein [Novisyntrophococcus fermenticellae]
MGDKSNKHAIHIRNKIPPIGMRMIKSAVAVFLCFVVHMLLGGKRDIMQSIIAAAICIQSRMDYSARTGFERIAGTLIGAAFGCLIVLLFQYVPAMGAFGGLPKYIIISLAVVPVIYTTVLLRLTNTSIMACVVLFAVTLGQVGDNPIIYTLNRVIDTLIGILIAIGVNLFELPHYHNNDILFISGVDDTLLNMRDSLTSYSKIELNRMISQGAKFTVFTKRTPASLVEVIKDVDLQLPVIAMDGAVLYDVRENQYLKLYVISGDTIKKLLDFFELIKVNCFISTFIGDIAVIYCPEHMTAIEEKEYTYYRKSPYRQYVNGKLPDGQEATYVYVIADEEKITEVMKALCNQEFGRKLKVKAEPSKEFPGNYYLRIYSKNASKKNMIAYLREYVGVEKTITFGNPSSNSDVIIHDGDANRVIKTMRRLYRPLLINKLKKK